MQKILSLSTSGFGLALILTLVASPSADAQYQISNDCPIHGNSVRIPTKPLPQYSNSRSSRQIADMVNSLRGGPNRGKSVSRSIKVNPKALPKGSSSYSGSGRSSMSSNFYSPTYRDQGSAGDHRYPTSPYAGNTSNYGGNTRNYGSTSNHHNHSHSGEFSYHVDHECQLCTNDIKFLKNSTLLADESSLRFLHNLAYALQDPALANQRFVVEGHASSEGSYSTNQILSQRRANAIFDFLVNRGVHPSRLLSVGHGEAQARYSSRSPEYLRAKDRRVMVFKLSH